jgi:hypothetical protein
MRYYTGLVCSRRAFTGWLLALAVTACAPATLPATLAAPSATAAAAPAGPSGTPEVGVDMGKLDDQQRQLVELARADLAGRLGIAVAQTALTSISARQWGDASLGCPEPGKMYAQVITPGFLIVLSAQGKQYQYHSDNKRVRLCETNK